MKQAFLIALCLFSLTCSSLLFGQTNYSNDPAALIEGDKFEIPVRPAHFAQLVAVNYDALDAVQKNGKLELGVQLPEGIRSRVANYISKQKNQETLNPFDPEELDITAFFTRQNKNGSLDTVKAYGFYYQEFRRNGNLKSWAKIQDRVYPEFRIRFAPREVGVWNCVAVVRVHENEEFYETPPLSFQVVESNLPGFIEVSENKRYLQVDDTLFLPLGMNMPTQGGPETGYRSTGARPDEYFGYYDALKDLKNSGGNYFRYMCTPWTTEIEFEELGNYGDRLAQAWEMDKVVETCEDLGLRMHWNMSYMTQLTTPGVFSLYFWDWTDARDSAMTCKALPNWFPNDNGFCYHTDEKFGVETVEDFLTNPESIRFYQNRLRYMLSRWGYSTSIGVLELFNEVNYAGLNFGLTDDCQLDYSTEYKPYFNDTSFVRKLSDWQIEMGRYIKEDLQHFNQPYCINFGGAPNYATPEEYPYDPEDGASLAAGDEAYFSEYVDIMSYNDYFRWAEKYEYEHKDLKKMKRFAHKKYKDEKRYEKPLMYSEIGMGMHGCDQVFTFRQLYVMSPFTGAAGAGMPWHYNNNMPEYDSVQQRELGWSIMPVVADFFTEVPLNQGVWEPGFDVRKDKRAEIVYLTEGRSSAQRAVAVINNRTVNRYSMREAWCDSQPQKCDCALEDWELENLPDVYETAQALDWRDERGFGRAQILKISGMEYSSKYQIVFYDGLTGEYVSELTKRSDIFGNLKIKYPELSSVPKKVEGKGNGSMLLVKVRKYDTASFSDMSK